MPENVDSVARRVAKFERDRFTGSAVTGSLPRVPSRTALPTAGAAYEGCIVFVGGATGHIYVCKQTASVYEWKQLDN